MVVRYCSMNEDPLARELAPALLPLHAKGEGAVEGERVS